LPISHKEYSQANTNGGLDNLGPFSLSHWKHIAKIHILFSSNIGDFYIAWQAHLRHYQEAFLKFLSALESYNDCMPVYLYIKDHDYNNHFLSI
jgi:hypothetical protein